MIGPTGPTGPTGTGPIPGLAGLFSPPPEYANDSELIAFFKEIGYGVGWDHDRGRTLYWHEILDDKRMIVQIDMGVPLPALIEDLPLIAEGKTGTSMVRYEIRAKNADDLQAFVSRCLEGWKKRVSP